MPRPRMFDEDAVLDAAMRAFWAVGYEATSTEDLCAATGLRRSSLYNAFTSKRDIFEAALRRYMSVRTAALIEVLDGDGPAEEKIRAVLWEAVDAERDDPVGCLVVNTMVELGPREPAIAEALRRDQQRRLAALRQAISAGQRDGTISTTRPASELAEFVTATISGLRVVARGGADRATREAIATIALDAL